MTWVITMAHVYDNWERLVRATLRMEDLRITGEKTPSEVSSISSSLSSPSFNSRTASSSFKFSKTAASPVQFSSLYLSSFLLAAAGRAFEYAEILEATDRLSESNLIKRGRSGDLFRGRLRDKSNVVVKKIDLSSSVEKQERLVTELGVLGKVSHNRLVPLLGYCLQNKNNDDRFLVYKYMPYKDLSSFRGLESDGNDSSQSLDFVRRMKIAIGAAEGLCYLHHECVPPLAHRRSDQGPSGSPEAAWEDDVYCFGKILLELVTGKLGMSASSSDAAMKEWLEQTLPLISIYEKELLPIIIDPSLIIDEDLLEEVWAVAIVARSCLNPRPSRRPLMRYVLKALENPHEVLREPIDSLLIRVE
ncbi:probable LRR receptor-like serine/threonine-protein kinase At2g16250 isoform X2 [Coffea arabica]|uniref:Probable LRR receptor-like serine/threonine-protein kinase At2g16250 isoform X2 n=1 Tax=Coffea arabica TaxID=13443 RepID=A0ABM4UZT9_COFAR